MSEYATLIALSECTGYHPVISKVKHLILSDVFDNITFEVSCNQLLFEVFLAVIQE